MEKQVLQYGLKGDEIVSVYDVESGLACKCMCPYCKKALLAKKGEKRIWHFAHRAPYADCEYGQETSLHLLAKKILLQTKRFVLPKVLLENGSSSIVLSGSREIFVEKVQEEKFLGTIKPDILLESGNDKYCVEIFVTHKIDENKRAKIIEADLETIEIDLSKETRIDENKLKDILLTDNDNKRWIYNKQINLVEKEPIKTKQLNSLKNESLDDRLLGENVNENQNSTERQEDKKLVTRKDPLSIKENYDGVCPKCGRKMKLLYNKYGAYYQCENCPDVYPHAPLRDRFCPKCERLLTPQKFESGNPWTPILLECKNCGHTEEY